MKGFIVQPDYVTVDGKTFVQLFGRLENNESFVAMIAFDPYFFVRKSDEKEVKNIFEDRVTFEKVSFKTFEDEPVIKVIFQNQAELNNLRKELHEEDIDTFEGDIKPQYRYLIDKGLLGGLDLEGDYESTERVDRVYNNPEIKPAKFSSDLKVASIDIESRTEKDGLFCIGIYSKNYEKNFIVSDKKVKNAVACKDEEECLERFKEELIDLDPDIITGWNVIDFDFAYLKKMFDKYKIKFDLGRTTENSRLRIEDNFFRSSSMKVSGRLVLDGLNFVRDPYIKEAPTIKNANFESFTLEAVSQALLGEGKLLKGKGRINEIVELYEYNKETLVEYNLMDCKLAYKILDKGGFVALGIERSQLTGMPLDRTTASIASFDSLYIRRARKKGFVSPTTRFSKKENSIKGGFVMSPEPGLYSNVLVFDFKSLYPSIIRTFNVDPSSFLLKKKKNCIEAPNGACFKNLEGILPEIIEELHQAREKAKKEKRELSSYAIKIIMNSFFGVLASPNSRYFNFDMGNAITNFGQEIIKLTSKKLEEKGYKVIYGDTDSVFVEAGVEDTEKVLQVGKDIAKEINNFYEGYAKEKFDRKSFLELEFEKLYTSLMMPQNRGSSEKGAKKRYAGMVYGKGLEIVGLEAIRGDWTEAAQEFQIKLLEIVFSKKNPEKFVRNYVKDLMAGKFDDKLIYRKSIRKNLEEYVKTTPPHVKAARKLKKLESSRIEYYITTDGPEPIQNKKHKIDYEHYIDKQIKPIAIQVLSLLGKKFEEVISGERQESLF